MLHRARLRRRPVQLLILVAGLVTIPGCSRGNTPSEFDAAQRASVYHILFEGYSPKEDAARSNTAATTIRKCMAAQGIDYAITTQAPTNQQNYDITAGVPDDAFARRWGLGVYTDRTIEDTEFAPASIPEAQQRVMRRDSTAGKKYYTTLYGSWRVVDDAPVPDNAMAGCGGEGLKRANPIMYAMNAMPSNARKDFNSFYEEVDNDLKVRSANSLWTQCMDASGIPVGADGYKGLTSWLQSRHPLNHSGTHVVSVIQDGISHAVSIPTYNPQEIKSLIDVEMQIAATAVKCGHKVGLNESISSKKSRLSASWLDKYGPLLYSASKDELSQTLTSH